MQAGDRTPLVLARMPDLSESSETGELATVSNCGRVLSQGLSFRLLGGAVVLLVAGAILPFVIGGGQRASAPPDDRPPRGQFAASETAPLWSDTAVSDAKPPAPPAVVVKASPATETAPCVAVVPEARQAAKTAATEPLMSPWPNPALSKTPPAEARGEELPAGANRAMAIRPEYLGNNHDRIGSGIH